MMLRIACAVALMVGMVMLSPTVAADEVVITGGDQDSTFVPVSVEAPKKLTQAVLVDGSGKKLPSSLRDGELVAIVDTIKAGEKVTLSVVEEAPATPAVELKKRGDEDIIDVHIDGKHFTSFYYTDKYPRPFLWPINTVDGVGITRNYPMGEDEVKQDDHPHHQSLWTAYGNIGRGNFWHNDAGVQRVDTVTFGSGDAYGWIVAEATWISRREKPIVNEVREYRFYATPEEGRLMDVKVALTPVDDNVEFRDTKEGGIVAVRMRPDMTGDKAIITNAFGDNGEPRCWGKPSPWCDYSSDLADIGLRGLTIMDHPDNLRHPTSWHVRGYGLMAANCFGYSHFRKKRYNQDLPESGDYTLKANDTLTFQYRVYVHTGDAKGAAVAKRYGDYAEPLKAKYKK